MGVVSLLREGTVSGSFHYAAGATATHCLHMLEKGDSETSALHLLGMLKDCLANLRPTVRKYTNRFGFKYLFLFLFISGCAEVV